MSHSSPNTRSHSLTPIHSRLLPGCSGKCSCNITQLLWLFLFCGGALRSFMHQHRLFISVFYMSTASERTSLVYRHQSASWYVVGRCGYGYIASDYLSQAVLLEGFMETYLMSPIQNARSTLFTSAHVGLGCGSSRGAPVWMHSK